MIASDQRNAFWIPDFESEQQKECFYWIEAAINEVAHEEIICIWAVASNLEQLH